MSLLSRNNHDSEEHQKAREEEHKARQRVINAYHRIFQSEDGQMVLKAMGHVFKWNKSMFDLERQHQDPYAAAVRDGQANVKRHIDEMLALPVVGDANIVVGKPKVIR